MNAEREEIFNESLSIPSRRSREFSQIDETLPFDLEEAKRNLKAVNFGPAVLVSCPCGKRLDNEELLSKLLNTKDKGFFESKDLESFKKNLKDFVENTGVNLRFDSSHLTPDLESVGERSAYIGSMLLEEIIRSKNWDGIDFLVVSSAFLPQDVAGLICDISGIKIDTIKSYRMACAGSAVSFIDACLTPSLKDKRGAILALEPLSFLMGEFTPKNVGISSIFGDDFSGIGFIPGEWEVSNPLVRIVDDPQGVIKMQTFYSTPANQPSLVPDYYQFKREGEKILSFSEEGVFLRIKTPKNGRSEMDGFATARFFIKETVEVLEELQRKSDLTGLKVVSHQPSKAVIQGIRNVCDKRGIELNLEFYLSEMNRSNSSSATFLVTWMHMAEKGLVNPAESFLILSQGIGAAVVAGIVKAKAL